MAGIPSIGDILMMSQLAWKIGRAFTAGRKGAPSEFLEVETEVNGLAKGLKLLAEALFADVDDSLLSRADSEIKSGIATILHSCHQTLRDLESLVEQYQVIKKTRTGGGFAVERSWSELVVLSYKTMMWTTEGGNIQALRNMLHMHMCTLTLTTQAIQSKSLSRLTQIVTPMAEKFDEIHNQLTGDLGAKIDEVHRIVTQLAAPGTPILGAQQPETRPESVISHLDINRSILSPQDRRHDSQLTLLGTPELVGSDVSSIMSRRESDAFSDGHHSPLIHRATPSAPVRRQSQRKSQGPLSTVIDTPELEAGDVKVVSSIYPLMSLPPPALKEPPDPGIKTYESTLPNLERQYCAITSSHPEVVPSLGPEVVIPDRETVDTEKTAISPIEQDTFERAAFRNSAILCDVQGTLVEYTQPVDEENRPNEMEMVESCRACRICIVRRRDVLSNESVRIITSIWVFSDDRTVRMQQKLADGIEAIPYASYFSPEKISIAIPTEIKFHDSHYDAKPLKVVKTNWINYVFSNERSANLFQAEIFGRSLLGSYKTEKTLRIHDGFSGVLAYQEQMCALENLRLWEDEGTSGVLAMIHFSAHFRNGYLAFYLNSSSTPVRVKDEGGKEVKIKGLSIPLTEQGKMQRRSSVTARRASEDRKRVICGARVEFATENEKMSFLAKVKEVQRTMIALPDL